MLSPQGDLMDRGKAASMTVGQMRPPVLVVEDEALILFDLCMALEDEGFPIAGEALNLSDARRSFEANEPKVAVLDINVGRETVWPLARFLKSQGVALVFVSANLHHQELQDEFGCYPQLEKPVNSGDLVKAIERAASGSAL